MANSKNALALVLTYFLTLNFANLASYWWAKSPYIYLFLTIINLLGAGLMLGLNYRYPYHNQFERRPAPWSVSLLYLGLGLLGLFISQKLALGFESYVLHLPSASANTQSLLTITKSYPYYALTLVLAAPLMEELVFRKVLFGTVSDFTNKLYPLLGSTLLFVLAHNDGHFLVYAFMGLILSGVYYKTGKISISVGCHLGMNLLILLLSQTI